MRYNAQDTEKATFAHRTGAQEYRMYRSVSKPNSMSIKMLRCFHDQRLKYMASHSLFDSVSDSPVVAFSLTPYARILTLPTDHEWPSIWILHVAGPTPWNSLPNNLRDPLINIDCFKLQLKTLFMPLHLALELGFCRYVDAPYKSTYSLVYFRVLMKCAILCSGEMKFNPMKSVSLRVRSK